MSSDVLLLKIVEVLSRLEVDVITELWPVDVLQEVEVMLFFTRNMSNLPARAFSCDVHCTAEVVRGCAHW